VDFLKKKIIKRNGKREREGRGTKREQELCKLRVFLYFLSCMGGFFLVCQRNEKNNTIKTQTTWKEKKENTAPS
jgi:hypothetical protein